jgi:hypothetical protein
MPSALEVDQRRLGHDGSPRRKVVARIDPETHGIGARRRQQRDDKRRQRFIPRRGIDDVTAETPRRFGPTVVVGNPDRRAPSVPSDVGVEQPEVAKVVTYRPFLNRLGQLQTMKRATAGRRQRNAECGVSRRFGMRDRRGQRDERE